MEVTISKLLTGRLPRLKHKEDTCTMFEEANPYEPKHPLVERATYVGLECEIENVAFINKLLEPYWDAKQDGSLRNRGMEFVSIPIKVSRLEQALHTLFTTILKPGYEYTERCSTHVHMNVRTLTIQQIKTLVLTYMIFEKVLFKWIGQDRSKNIFCVPLYDVTITNNFCENLDDIARFQWKKYTALNLAPILDRGTVEFRHLYGTDNIRVIMTWVNMMLCLKRFALRVSPDYIINKINTLNTSSEYYMLGIEVFGDLFNNELRYYNFERDISPCVSNIKAQCLAIPRRKATRELFDYLDIICKPTPTIPTPKKATTRTIAQIIQEREERRVRPLVTWGEQQPPPIQEEARLDIPQPQAVTFEEWIQNPNNIVAQATIRGEV